MSENLWRLVFDDERFNDMDMHHFSWGSAYKPEASDLLAAVRAGVESGTIKGAIWETDSDWWADFEDDIALMLPGTYLVIPVSDGGSET